jgi:acetyl-CoA carboxylase biotin carboxyl carrier protein
MEGGADESGALLDPSLIGEIVRRLQSTDIDELEVTDGSSRLYLRREPGAHAVMYIPGAASRDEQVVDGAAVTAPLTGVFYARPAPDEPAFVEVGTNVEVDDVVALIETMKLFNEVRSEVAGQVSRILARDGDLVEAGQSLMFVTQSAVES